MTKSKEPTAIDLLVAKLEAAKEALASEGKALLREEVDKYFAKYPKLKKFSWRQYTPYFNDGDTCEFSVDYSVDINGGDYEDYSDDSENESSGGEDKWIEKADEELSNLIESFPEDILYDLFGDHAEVTVTRKTFKVEEYDHE